jgi:hypothetical protein
MPELLYASELLHFLEGFAAPRTRQSNWKVIRMRRGKLSVRQFARETSRKVSSQTPRHFARNKKVPLDRDLLVGRQRAVTRHGIFESMRIWDEALPENLRTQEWFNSEDLGKRLAVAKLRYGQPQQTAPLHARQSRSSSRQ